MINHWPISMTDSPRYLSRAAPLEIFIGRGMIYFRIRRWRFVINSRSRDTDNRAQALTFRRRRAFKNPRLFSILHRHFVPPAVRCFFTLIFTLSITSIIYLFENLTRLSDRRSAYNYVSFLEFQRHSISPIWIHATEKSWHYSRKGNRTHLR